MSLVPICGKILERLMFMEVLWSFIENKLISSNQSGVKTEWFMHQSAIIYNSRKI